MKEEWISVKDRLPSKGRSRKQWQIMRVNGTQACAWFGGKYFNIGYTTFKDVTHWMPLPAPPKSQ